MASLATPERRSEARVMKDSASGSKSKLGLSLSISRGGSVCACACDEQVVKTNTPV